jgi:CheY-like chemotaxis protein
MTLEILAGRRTQRKTPLHNLMPKRITRLLLVSSLYDSFIFEEEGELTELLFAEYVQLNLRYAPLVDRVSTGPQALEKLKSERYDLVISMLRVGEMDVRNFSRRVKEIAPDVPLIVLAYNTRELSLLDPATNRLPHVNRAFVWQGDHRLFLAIIKYLEDRMNVEHDASTAGVHSIIVVEDSVRFYSSYLPMLYEEVVKQTQSLMAEGGNLTQRLIRMRARPKILLATTYEEAEELYNKHRETILGVIADVAFPRGGKEDPTAGLQFARLVRGANPDRPVLIQSTDLVHRWQAEALGARFIHKLSPSLLADVRAFMRDYLGFGDFVFRQPEGNEVARATDLASLAEALRGIPAQSLLFHARRNHFSAWLMARTEFDLAYALRPRKVDEFENAEALRKYLIDAVMEHRQKTMAGVVAEFSAGLLDSERMFVKIGGGSLGGKGRGLAFMNSLLTNYRLEDQFPEVRIHVPPTAVLATDVFDQFMQGAGLLPAVLRPEVSDQEVKAAFLDAAFPNQAREALRSFLVSVRYPLAIRSSSLLEDASFQPFAGVYRTYMLANNHPSLEARLDQLIRAIKMVYASVYYADAKSYVEATPNRLEEEKMAVVIQQLVGQTYGDRHYPDFAGVARSRDYYPVADGDPEAGVALVALGLGNTVMDGGRCLRFSPARPHQLFQLSSVKDALRNSQREFFALDLANNRAAVCGPDDTYEHLVALGLEAAEEDGTLHAVGSVYSPDNDAIYDGISRPGVRLVSFSGVLKAGAFPLAELLAYLLKVGNAGFSCPVEMEFACKLRPSLREKHEFGFLQIRPLGSGPILEDVSIEEVNPTGAVCISRQALGHGFRADIRDLVYVRFDNFDRARTLEIAREVGVINQRLKQSGRPYILVGQGRWGSSDRWLGIPVTWSQISGATLIVETDLKDIRVEPSQGTHFFQNMTSLGIGYFSVNYGGNGGWLDQGWLDSQPAAFETEHVRHLEFPVSLTTVVDCRQRLGVIMKPGVPLAVSRAG